MTKIKPSTNKYKLGGIQRKSEKGDWKKIEKNNVTTALNVLYAKKEKYVLYNSNPEKQVILMIRNEEKRWH